MGADTRTAGVGSFLFNCHAAPPTFQRQSVDTTLHPVVATLTALREWGNAHTVHISTAQVTTAEVTR